MDSRRKRDVRVSNLLFDFESKGMDGVDSQMILEVPDTPDRLAATRHVAGSSMPNTDAVMRAMASRTGNSSSRNLSQSGSSSRANDADFFFKEAKLALPLPKATQTTTSSQSESRRKLQLPPATRVPNESVKKRETIDLSSESPVSVSDHKSSGRSWQKNRGSLGQSRTTSSPLTVEDESLDSFYRKNDELNSRDKGKGVDPCSSFQNGSHNSGKEKDQRKESEVASGPPARSSRRMLVRNGCISPQNIERTRNLEKQKEVEDRHNERFTRQIHVIGPDSQERHSDKMKRKVTAEDIVAAETSHIACHPNREHQLLGEEAIAPMDVDGGSHSFGDHGWRTTRNHMRTSPESTLIQDSQESQRASGRINGKRKVGLSHPRIGECSTSVSNGTERLSIGPSRQSLVSRAGRSHRSINVGITLGPVIAVDELQSPRAASDTDRDRQVESDEMLARQLQEELYNEATPVGMTNELDASIAFFLEENELQSSAVARRQQVHRGDSRAHSRQTSARATTRGRAPSSNRLAQLRRNYQMTMMNMRLEMLGATAFFDGRNGVRANNPLQSHRDFNEDDYEMLLALDENNHQHGGATESQINTLPVSKIQNSDSQEPCAVCLDPPAVGDTVRHLPCLHKFHKDCIDAWLRRKRACPICKSDIR